MKNTLDEKLREEINLKFEKASAQEILEWAIKTYPKVGLSSSFGAESALLLHMATQIKPDIPILFINTGFLFKETLEFKETLKKKFNLNIREFKADEKSQALVRERLKDKSKNDGTCCDAAKVELMQRALEGLDCWIAGLRRNQAVTRKDIRIVESYEGGLVKVHPIANWSSEQISDYMKKYQLPYHPLWTKGYRSIGCEPCTTLPIPGQDDRSGRWAGTEKTECGIHTFMKKQ